MSQGPFRWASRSSERSVLTETVRSCALIWEEGTVKQHNEWDFPKSKLRFRCVIFCHAWKTQRTGALAQDLGCLGAGTREMN